MENETNTTVDSTVEDNSSSTELSADEIVASVLDKEEPKTEETDQVSDQVGEQVTDQVKEQKDNTQPECPDKFKNEDGTVDVNKLAKSYKELEPLLNEKANWQKERAELLKAKEELDRQQQAKEDQAKSQGFESALDMQQEYALIDVEANEYAKYLQYVDSPQEVRDLLIQYANNPSRELLDDIELEFPAEVIKRVAVKKEQQRQQFQLEKQERQKTQSMANIEGVISQTVDNHRDLFNYKPVEQLFVKALEKYGETFSVEDAEVLMNFCNEFKETLTGEISKQNGIAKENKKATDELSSISQSNSSAPLSSKGSLLDLEGSALDQAISKLI